MMSPSLQVPAARAPPPHRARSPLAPLPLLALRSPTHCPPARQGEVALRCNERWLRRVSFLAGAEPEFMVQVALNLNAMVFAPGELAASNHLYIVHRGLALYGGRVLTSGRVWGEDMILQSVHLQTRYCARAMNYLEVYMIGRRRAPLALAHQGPRAVLEPRR